SAASRNGDTEAGSSSAPQKRYPPQPRPTLVRKLRWGALAGAPRRRSPSVWSREIEDADEQ
ncbi:MAG: hypothetical protein DMG51_19850, partial [Acidobacteria bacterium]